MTRTEPAPSGVRRDQANKSYETCRGYGGCGEYYGCKQNPAPQAYHVDAKARCDVVTQRQSIETRGYQLQTGRDQE